MYYLWQQLANVFSYIVTFIVCMLPTQLVACPICNTEVGQTVRQGIFNSQFFFHFFYACLPFIVLLGIVFFAYFNGFTHFKNKLLILKRK
ncbi:Uncharacterised protein [Legionella beliardensis]|uniref:Uncharacterized protein n=1 Tax=Legionella beliardensis TaxID=91822 RepID=A0A378IC23_9GAMM|nr:hypothetical protein [Legionella beliardensis]STX29844.1 Uncharacterised protein [Legionella beliardensis]